MPLNVAFVQHGNSKPLVIAGVEESSKEELQAVFDEDYKKIKEDPGKVVKFFHFEGEVADAIENLLKEKGDEFFDGFNKILRDLCGL